jgi:hypothetical protein
LWALRPCFRLTGWAYGPLARTGHEPTCCFLQERVRGHAHALGIERLRKEIFVSEQATATPVQDNGCYLEWRRIKAGKYISGNGKWRIERDGRSWLLSVVCKNDNWYPFGQHDSWDDGGFYIGFKTLDEAMVIAGEGYFRGWGRSDDEK